MRHQAVQAHRRCGPVEAGPAEDPVAQHSPAPQAGEDQLVETPAGQVLAQLVGEEGRNGHRPALVALRHAPDEHAVDLDDGLGDLDPATHQVDPPDLERGQLAPAQPAVGQHEHDEAVGGHGLPLAVRQTRTRPGPARLFGEAVDLGVGQVAAAALVGTRQVDAVAGIAGQPPVLDRQVQHEAEDAKVLAHGGRRRAGRPLLGDPALYVGVRHGHQLELGPVRQDVAVEDAAVPRPGGRLQMCLADQPLLRPLADRDATRAGVHVRPRLDGRRD